MPGLFASGPTPAVVAYAQVKKDGTSPDMNSGVETSRSAQGTYLIDLPAGLAQPLGRDVVLLTVRIDDDVVDQLYGLSYNWNSTSQIQVNSWIPGGEGSTRNDVAFDFVLLRSTLTPVTDEPS